MHNIAEYLRTLRLFHWAIFAVVAISTFTVMYYHITSSACYPGTTMGRTCYRGYYTNIDDRGGDNVLPVIKNGQAVPRSDINSADSFYALLRAAYSSPSKQKHTGASFIYNTMMGNRAPGIGRNVSDAQWADLYQRMKALDLAGKIDWGGNVSVSVNTYWQGVAGGFGSPDGTNDDEAYYGNFKNEAGITIRDYNNNVVYQILRRCANPIGQNAGLPPLQNYTLTPHMDSLSPTDIEAGSKVSVAGSVDNQGQVASKPTQWEITQMTVKPGAKAPHEDENGTISNEAPCQGGGGAPTGNYFNSADSTCKNITKGTGSFNLGLPAQNLKPSASGIDVGDLPVGTRVCFALSIQPRSNASAEWAHSKPICTVVGKKPKVQIWGSDISVRGKIETSASVKNVSGTTRTFGSWVEYGAFSVGVNSRFASGSGTNNQTDNNQATWSKLTFANKDNSGVDSFGNYANATNFRPAPTLAAYFGSIQNRKPVGAASVDVGSLTFATGGAPLVYTASNLTITGGNIPAGRSVIIIATGAVTIDGPIMYTDAVLNGVKDIPQVVIIAGNINIKDSVSRVDSWLITNGTINTCYNFVGNLTSGKCGALLEVNGPVVTGKLILNRTGGSGTGLQSGDPAEKFNLRPDTFLWAQLQGVGNSKAQTVYSAELPPRF